MRAIHVFLALAVLATAVSARADDFYVESTEIVGPVTYEQRDRIQEYIRSAIAGQAAHSVVTSQETADYVLQPKVIRDGDRYTVVMEKSRAGRVVWAGRTDPIVEENLGSGISRLVQGMAAGVAKGDQDVDITVITSASAERRPPPAETRVTRTTEETREIPARQFFLGFGPAFLPEEIDASDDPQLGLNLAYNWDQDYAVINIFGDLVFVDSDVGVVGGGMGLNYLILPDRAATPFVGAQLGYGAVFPEGDEDSIGGFLVNGVLGAQLFRESSVNMEVSFRFGWFTSEVGGETPFLSALLVGIHFGGDA